MMKQRFPHNYLNHCSSFVILKVTDTASDQSLTSFFHSVSHDLHLFFTPQNSIVSQLTHIYFLINRPLFRFQSLSSHKVDVIIIYHLFNHYREAKLKEPKILPRFIIYNLNNNMLMAGTEGKQQDFLDKIVRKVRTEVTINWEKTECQSEKESMM